jgi:hypothetical protein
MKTQMNIQNKFTSFILVLAGIILLCAASALADDPRTNCWFTTYSGQYARIYTNNAMLASGTVLTTWSNGSQTQSLPTYDGVQEVDSSASWIYIRSTGLASYNMGPWQNGAFPNLPVNQKILFRFPRTNAVPTTKTETGGGQIGIFVDGVEMFNSWDAFTWDPSTSADTANYTGYWNRDAYVNEGATFDPGNAHQQNTGTYHYHASPIALRYLLGDHVDFNPATKTYYEDTNVPTKHSPILAWTADGFPVYGPYGYSDATNANSGIRRMISGYVLRNGQFGTDNLPVTGRLTIPQWAVRLYNVSSNQTGAPLTGIHTNGCYMEDNDYLGDLINSNTGTNFQQGVDFDLDEYNGRYCVTPEFPNGTYAYFVAISSNGTPVFPYNIGRGYYGSPTGGSVTNISETVVTNFLGNTNLASTLNAPGVNNGTVTLTWSAVEGGSYQIEATTNFSSWTILATNVSPNEILGRYTNVTSLDNQFYRVGRTAVASFDPVSGSIGTGGGGGTQGISSVLPASANRGTNSVADNVTLTITLNSGATMPPPPDNVQPTSVTLSGAATITATSYSRNTSTGVVTATFNISSTASSGAYTVSAVFGPNTWSLANGFTIN